LAIPPHFINKMDQHAKKKLYVDDFSAFGEAYFTHIVRLQSPVVVQKEGFE